MFMYINVRFGLFFSEILNLMFTNAHINLVGWIYRVFDLIYHIFLDYEIVYGKKYIFGSILLEPPKKHISCLLNYNYR